MFRSGQGAIIPFWAGRGGWKILESMGYHGKRALQLFSKEV